jgi:hypothetical protein
MSNVVMVNIRLFREDLLAYRLMALQEGKSLSAFIRDILRSYAKHHRQARSKGERVWK